MRHVIKHEGGDFEIITQNQRTQKRDGSGPLKNQPKPRIEFIKRRSTLRKRGIKAPHVIGQRVLVNR